MKANIQAVSHLKGTVTGLLCLLRASSAAFWFVQHLKPHFRSSRVLWLSHPIPAEQSEEVRSVCLPCPCFQERRWIKAIRNFCNCLEERRLAGARKEEGGGCEWTVVRGWWMLRPFLSAVPCRPGTRSQGSNVKGEAQKSPFPPGLWEARHHSARQTSSPLSRIHSPSGGPGAALSPA